MSRHELSFPFVRIKADQQVDGRIHDRQDTAVVGRVLTHEALQIFDRPVQARVVEVPQRDRSERPNLQGGLRDDTELPVAQQHAFEQVGVLVLVALADLPGGRHHLHGHHLVGRAPESW